MKIKSFFARLAETIKREWFLLVVLLVIAMLVGLFEWLS